MNSNFTRCVHLALAVTILLPALENVRATAEDEDPLEARIVDVKSYGEPRTLGKATGAHFFLWFDDEGWHLRSDAGKNTHTFSGVIEVVDGEFVRVSNFESLSTSGKKTDRGRASKRRIVFQFKTTRRPEGFDFQISEDAKELRFKLLIDGKALGRNVLIGAAAQPAPADVFALEAHPKE